MKTFFVMIFTMLLTGIALADETDIPFFNASSKDIIQVSYQICDGSSQSCKPEEITPQILPLDMYVLKVPYNFWNAYDLHGTKITIYPPSGNPWTKNFKIDPNNFNDCMTHYGQNGLTFMIFDAKQEAICLMSTATVDSN